MTDMLSKKLLKIQLQVISLKLRQEKKLDLFLESIQGTVRQCKVVKLSMQCCGQIPKDLFEAYKTFPRCIITELECICRRSIS